MRPNFHCEVNQCLKKRVATGLYLEIYVESIEWGCWQKKQNRSEFPAQLQTLAEEIEIWWKKKEGDKIYTLKATGNNSFQRENLRNSRRCWKVISLPSLRMNYALLLHPAQCEVSTKARTAEMADFADDSICFYFWYPPPFSKKEASRSIHLNTKFVTFWVISWKY